ncbi:hypothetical protein ACHWQZ_G009862 [Mnemiopsis leidyi]
MFVCDYCEEASPDMKRCGNCLTVRYCNETCQVAHWSLHQQNCKPQPLNLSSMSNSSVSSDATILDNGVSSDPAKSVLLNVTEPDKSVRSNVTLPDKGVISYVTEPEKSVISDATEPDKSVTSDVTEPEKSVISDVTEPEKSVTSDATAPDKSVISDATEPEKSVTSDVTEPDKCLISDVTEPDKATTSPSPADSTVVVRPVFDDPTNPGFGILHSSTPKQLVNFQTGRTFQLDEQAMLKRYKGVEEEMTLKIQVPWTEEGLPCTSRELWVYNQSRDFTVCILPADPNCRVIRDKILEEGLLCIRPGKKLYFRARLSAEFLLHVQLDRTVDAKW